MEKSFYEAKNKKEAMEIYLRGENELYARVKNNLIIKELEEVFGKGAWDSLKILEIGPGGGAWTNFFLKKKAKVVCVDICPVILEANLEIHPEAEFVLADATEVQLKEKFDLVFAKDVIEHIKDDRKFLSNMNSHLKERGLIMIITQNSWSLNYLIQGGYNFIKGNRDWKGWDPTHLRFYNYISLNKKLNQADFKPFKWFGSYYFPYRMLPINKFKINECLLEVFCFLEKFGLSDKFLINILGWSIGVLAKKNNIHGK